MMRKPLYRPPPKQGEVLGYDFSCYFDNRDCDPMSREEEQKWTDRANYGDREAINKLTLANIRWTIHLASAFVRRHRRGMMIEDAVQAGIIGLKTAIAKFQPARGLRVSTYATDWIIQAMQREQAKYLVIHVPVQHWQKKPGEGSNPELRRLANRALALARFSEISKKADQFGNEAPAVEDWLADRSEQIVTYDPPPADKAPKQEDVGWLMRGLKDREKFVLRRRFRDEAALHEIGEELGLSKERVRQIELTAIKKMQARARSAA
jgi:RNA polymerase sigma factor (sigma-70 family)